MTLFRAGCLFSLISLAAASPAAAVELQVLSINLRSVHDDADRRLPLIREHIDRNQPDVILMQEVGRLDGRNPTQAHVLATAGSYRVVAVHNERTNRGLAILSRLPVVEVEVWRLPPRERPALAVTLDEGHGPIRVVDVHLSPQLDAVAVRETEVRAVLDRLNRTPGVPFILGGDFNFGDDGRENRLLTGLTDVFRSVRPHVPGYTYDLANPLARRNAYAREPSRRLDRLLLSDPRMQVEGCRRVLNQPAASGLFPSDHYGLYATLAVPMSVVSGAVDGRRNSPRADQ